MRIGIRVAISGLVLASIVVSAVGVNVLWWRTANQISNALAATINEQIVSAVSDELQSVTTEVRSAYTAVRTLLAEDMLQTTEPEKRQFVFLSQLRAQPTISWIAFGWPDGAFAAAHKLGDSSIELIEIDAGKQELMTETYDLVGESLTFKRVATRSTSYVVTAQGWFANAIKASEPLWSTYMVHPDGERLAVALAGPVDIGGKREGVLAIMVELTRVSQFLSQLTVGKSASAFILDRKGQAIAAPDPDADEVNALKTNQPLFPVAVDAMTAAADAYDPGNGQAYRSRITRNGNAYEVVLTPISFPGWSLVTVVPESEFLGPVQTTIRNLLIGLALLIVVAGLVSAWLAQRLVAAPLMRVVHEIGHVERFDLDKVRRHPSQLTEIQNLSGAIADMALGLSAFRKYIPADLVRRLISQGGEAELGGAVKPMTVMFADMAGFTGMSERLGDRIIPLLSRYFDLMSVEVQQHGGTIDKFIGDAVMAFWGAPAPNADHAVDCCRAALACQHAMRDAGLCDESGAPIMIRIGINSGDMLVGNIGSEVRLNYTVIGDAVNIASRLEGANKIYGSEILIGPETRRLAGGRIIVREVDRLAVYGRSGGLQIYELLAMTGSDVSAPEWVGCYERGLAHYRARDFAGAAELFAQVLGQRPDDRPSAVMLERCRSGAVTADGDWSDTTIARIK